VASLFEDGFVVIMNVGAVIAGTIITVFVVVGKSLVIYVFSAQEVGKPIC